MNAKELAALLKVHPETIRRMIRNKEIQAEKKGRSFIIPSDEVERLIKENSHTPVEGVLEKLDFVEAYMKKELSEMEESLRRQGEQSLQGKPMESYNDMDIMDLIDVVAMHQKIINQLAFIKRYLAKGGTGNKKN